MTGLTAALDRITVGDLRRNGGLKWTAGGPEVLGAFVAEMDFGTAPAVEDALRAAMGRGTYLAWLDCRPLGLGDHPGQFFLDRARVLVNDGPAFGDAGKGHVRLNFATPRPILTQIVTQLAAAVHADARP